MQVSVRHADMLEGSSKAVRTGAFDRHFAGSVNGIPTFEAALPPTSAQWRARAVRSKLTGGPDGRLPASEQTPSAAITAHRYAIFCQPPQVQL